MRRRRRLRNAPSSKSDIVESLLRLGDVARNSQVGEVKVALEKAKAFIDKFSLTQFNARYQQLVEKLTRFERGEKVERDDAGSQSRSQSSAGQEWWQSYQQRRHERQQQRQKEKAEKYRQWYEQQQQWYKRQQEQSRARRDYARTAQEARNRSKRQRREEAKAQQHKEKKTYTRPRKSAGIEWLWTKAWSPKRGKAGERWKAYYGAATVEEMLAKGGRWSDVKWNVTHNLMRIRQPDE